ncbi:hypothetical protein ACWC4D_31500 [Streptomyces sp. NPDC001288]|uniref:hypothetical protein n=1 Tax=unclassified Streptomyces TaxID=2593676 RepID=UPI003332C510
MPEIEPWHERDQVWRGLDVTFPPSHPSHSEHQQFYFGSDGLLRRHDYHVDVAGGFAAAQYVHDIVEADGIRLPSVRRAYRRDSSGRAGRATRVGEQASTIGRTPLTSAFVIAFRLCSGSRSAWKTAPPEAPKLWQKGLGNLPGAVSSSLPCRPITSCTTGLPATSVTRRARCRR